MAGITNGVTNGLTNGLINGVANSSSHILPNSFGEFIAVPNYNHVTVVQVEESPNIKNRFDDDFVTVLQVGEENNQTDTDTTPTLVDTSLEEEIIIYRLPGERLGMALKFEGGINANEKINKVFIQSINTDSPASKVRGQQLEFLREGDQIMQIDGTSTTTMTRLECIGLLRDAPVCIKIRVRRDSGCQSSNSSNDSPVNYYESSLNSNPNQSETANQTANSISKANNWLKKASKVPPPVPKRSQTTILSSKRKNSVNNYLTRSDSDSDPIEKPPRKKLSQPPPLPPRRPKVPPPKPPNVKNGETDEQNIQNRKHSEIDVSFESIESIESKVCSSEAIDLMYEEVIETKLERIEKQFDSENKSNEPTLPSEADVYLDLLVDEDRLLIESESDDTGSSVSTIIERFSRTSTANSSFSDHINRKTPTIDIVGRVLSPFEKLERELDHKEALQAFVNKAAAVLMADEDLRQITEESLGNKHIQMYVEEYVETTTVEFSDKSLVNLNQNEVLPNQQIIVPPEEFCNPNTQNDSEDFEFCESPTKLSEKISVPEECFRELELFGLNMNLDLNLENDSIENEMEFIDKILNEVENEQKSQQIMVSEIQTEILKQEDLIRPLDPPVEGNVVSFQTNDSPIKGLIEDQIKCEETKTNEINLSSESETDIKMIDESNKTIEQKDDSVVNTLEAIDSIKNSFESNDNTIDNVLNCDNEKDLFQDIDELNREIEALEELVEYEIKMESLKESRNQKIETNQNLKYSKEIEEMVNKCNEKLIEESPKIVGERENTVQSHINGNKYSPPMSLIPRRLPSAAPRKSKSYGNLPALYASYKTPELKKPSLIPRPVSKTNLSIYNKNESPANKSNNSQNSFKVQNSKTVQKSKTRILSERKKNEVLNSNSIENKRTVHQRPGKSGLKCKSLMDLTTAFNSADVRNGVNDSEESIQSIEYIQNKRQNECQDIVLIETNRTESSLQSKQTDETIGGTESESQIDLREDIQKDIIVDTCLNHNTLSADNNIIDKSYDLPEDNIDKIPLITTPPEESVNQNKTENNAIKEVIESEEKEKEVSIFEPIVKSLFEPIVESTVEPTFEASVEPIVEPIVELTVEPPFEPKFDPSFEPTFEPIVETIVEPIVETIVEPIVETIVEPIVETIVEPIVETIVEPIVETIVEPIVETIVEPIVETIVEPIVETIVEPIEQIEKSEKEDSTEEEMLRMRRNHISRETLLSSSCAPPTYARQPPDGREITLNYMDGQSSNRLNSTLSCDVFQNQVHEDSGVFIDADTPSPELDFSSSMHTRGGPSNVAVTRIKYKSTNGDNSSDGDTGITSMSSDSMDELDSCPLPNYKLKKQIIERSRNPSSDFLSETVSNGLTNNTNKSFDSSNSVRERIAMFDNQTNDVFDIKENLRNMPKPNPTLKNDYPFDFETSALNGKNDLISERLSSNDKSELNSNKLISEKTNESLNGSVYNTKNSFIHKKSSSFSLTDNPQQSPTPVHQYSGHLQPSYLRYSSLGSTNDSSVPNNSYTGIGVHKPLTNGSLLSSILETRKQNASKLKGLIIPDIPTTSQPAVNKTMPTILSNTSTSSLLTSPKPEETVSLTQRSQVQSQSNLSNNYSPAQRQTSLLSETPSLPLWGANTASIPKYSPAFKRRQLELPRSLSMLNNVSHERSDSTDSFTPSFNRSNSMTTMSPNDSQFQFSLSHSKPVIPLMPETAVGSPNIDGITNAKSTPSLEEQLALSVNDSYRHSSVQRRYSADVFNYNNSLKFSLEKRSSADASINGLFKTQINSLTQNEIICNQSDRSPVLNNKLYHSLSYIENKTPIIPERKSLTNNNRENDYSIHRNIFNYNSNPMQSLNGNKTDNIYNRSIDKTFTRSLIHSDYSDDDSSTISHKTSEDSSQRADDSDTTSDDQSMSPELTRPKVLGTQLTVLKNQTENENISIKNDSQLESVKNFRALAEQWEQRSGSEVLTPNNKSIPPPLPPKPSANLVRMPPSLLPRTKTIGAVPPETVPTETLKPVIESVFCAKTEIRNLENTVREMDIIDEIDSMKTSIDSGSDTNSEQSVKSRSRSVSDICKVFESNGTDSPPQTKPVIIKPNSTVNSNKTSQINDIKTDEVEEDNPEVEVKVVNEELLIKIENTDEIETQIESPDNSSKLISEEKIEVIEKPVEKEEPTVLTHHQRMSSIDSLASDSGASSSGTAVRSLGLRTSSASNLRDSQYGSVSSLASSTSLISPQELQQLIEEANQSLETNDINNHNIQVVVLHREYKTSGSIGITLAGGSDCETKEITVHRVINGSITDRDGRIKRGDRILSINGKILKGVSHKEALDIMKAPRPEVVIVLSRVNPNHFSDNGFHSRQSSTDLSESTANTNNNSYQSLSEDISTSNQYSNRDSEHNSESNYKILRAELQKDVTGLGFILEGGKDSPLGDRPLAIKRIFRGGPADKEGTLASGDEVLTANEHSVYNMTRTEAWNFLKKIPEGPVVLVVKRKKY